MTTEFPSERQITYLQQSLRRTAARRATGEERGLVRMVAREEAAVLLLNLAGYSWDEETLEATKSVSRNK